MTYFLNKKHFENAKYYIKMIKMTFFFRMNDWEYKLQFKINI